MTASVFDIFQLPQPRGPTEGPSMVKELYLNCPPGATFRWWEETVSPWGSRIRLDFSRSREEGARIQRQWAESKDIFGVAHIRGLDLADGKAYRNKPSPMVSLSIEAKTPATKKSGPIHKYLGR